MLLNGVYVIVVPIRDFNIINKGNGMWKDQWIPILRAEINDFESERYTNDRLAEVLLSSMVYVLHSIKLSNSYTVNMVAKTISPDPHELDDKSLMVLSIAKAACLILSGESSAAAKKAFMIKDGPSVVDNRTASNNLQDIAKEKCQAYKDLLNEFLFSGEGAFNSIMGEAILGIYNPGIYYLNNRSRGR